MEIPKNDNQEFSLDLNKYFGNDSQESSTLTDTPLDYSGSSFNDYLKNTIGYVPEPYQTPEIDQFDNEPDPEKRLNNLIDRAADVEIKVDPFKAGKQVLNMVISFMKDMLIKKNIKILVLILLEIMKHCIMRRLLLFQIYVEQQVNGEL
jgi:hypothetical protein